MKGFTLTALLIATSAHGQTVDQVSNALDAIRAHEKLLQVSFDNLQGMTTGQDADVVRSIGNMLTRFRLSDEIAIAVADLLPHMRDTEDAQQARAQLQYSLDTVLQQADLAVKYVNSYMTLLKGAAARAETTKARDEMIMIREQLRSLKT